MNWYFAYNFFRLAGIMQGIKKRVIDGTASSAHAREMSERVQPLAARAWHFAKLAGAE
jgi:aminoglycoside phosphotransferase (APT) family kinase protein